MNATKFVALELILTCVGSCGAPRHVRPKRSEYQCHGQLVPKPPWSEAVTTSTPTVASLDGDRQLTSA